MKLKLKVFVKIFTKTKSYLTSGKYSKDSKYYDKTNKLAVGKMKDETYGVPRKSFVELKARMYTYVTKDQHVKKQKLLIVVLLKTN